MVDQLLDSWLHGRGENTRDAYRRDALSFLEHAGKDLVTIELGDLQRWDAALLAAGLAPSTRARKLSAVKSLLVFAREQGHLERDAGAAMKLPKGRDRLAERILSEREVTRMIALEDDPTRGLVLKLLYTAGLRVSELCLLRRRDVADREKQGQITVFGKGEKTREVLIGGETWEELQALRAAGVGEDERLFSLTRQQVWTIVREAAARAGIRKNVSPHWLRHAHASHSLDRGAPPHLVQKTLGHASLATTSRYAHARPDESSGKYLAI